MQKLLAAIIALILVLAIASNVLLFAQNQDLRRRLVSQPPAATPTSGNLEQVTADLERYKRDYNKAIGETLSLRERNTALGSAAEERDQLKRDLETLRQQNAQLQNQVQNLQTMNAINDQVAGLRGLKAQAAVPRSFMNQEQLRGYFTATYDKEYSAEAEATDAAVLRALDMGGEAQSGDLRKSQVDTMVKSVLGFYDQRTKQLVVVTNRPQMGVHDRITYAHETTHSLQDQYFDLTALFKQAGANADSTLAVRTLVEGDATLTMSLYAQRYLSAMDMVNYKLEAFSDLDPYSMLYGSGGSGPYVESAMYFPYQDGAQFVSELYANGGYAAVNQAFRSPPRSTEQVLHPEKYLAGEQPIAVQLPNLGAALGWKTVSENTLGELYVRIYLEHVLPIEQAIPAGEGWGGDRYQVLENDKGQLALALSTAWDSAADAQEFFDAYAAYVPNLGGGATKPLTTTSSTRRWQLADRQFYLQRSGNRVLVLHAPDAATLERMLAQFR